MIRPEGLTGKFFLDSLLRVMTMNIEKINIMNYSSQRIIQLADLKKKLLED